MRSIVAEPLTATVGVARLRRSRSLLGAAVFLPVPAAAAMGGLELALICFALLLPLGVLAPFLLSPAHTVGLRSPVRLLLGVVSALGVVLAAVAWALFVGLPFVWALLGWVEG